jgi:hypothetical protein
MKRFAFIEKVSRARSAGLSVAANALSIKETVQSTQNNKPVKLQPGAQRRFGNVDRIVQSFLKCREIIILARWDIGKRRGDRWSFNGVNTANELRW